MIELESNRPQKVDAVLDAKGLHCPLPILRTKAQLAELEPGDVLHVMATDPLAPLDFKSYAVHAAHKLIFMVEEKDHSEFFIEKGAA